MNTITLQKNVRELESFVKKANRKLLEFEVLRSTWENKVGKTKSYKSAKDFMSHISSKVK